MKNVPQVCSSKSWKVHLYLTLAQSTVSLTWLCLVLQRAIQLQCREQLTSLMETSPSGQTADTEVQLLLFKGPTLNQILKSLNLRLQQQTLGKPHWKHYSALVFVQCRETNVVIWRCYQLQGREVLTCSCSHQSVNISAVINRADAGLFHVYLNFL